MFNRNSAHTSSTLDKGVSSHVSTIIMAIITAILITATIVALPFTEKLSTDISYDLNLKGSQYRGKTYLLEIDVTGDDTATVNRKISETKSIFSRRLAQLGVESVRITNFISSAEFTSNQSEGETSSPSLGQDVGLTDLFGDQNKRYIRVTVETSKDISSVDTLIRTRNFIRLVTVKDGVIFGPDSDPFAPYLLESYDRTPFTRRSMRTVFVKELTTTTGDSAYFGIFKPKFRFTNQFDRFLRENAGQTIGISIDGFVTPYSIPLEFAQNNVIMEGSVKPLFAPSIAQTAEEAVSADILFNSGVIPYPYEVIDEMVVPVTSTENVDYPNVLFAILAALVGVFLFIWWRSRNYNTTRDFIVILTFTFILWTAGLKLLYIPIDLDIAIFALFISVMTTKALTFNQDHRFETILLLLVSSASATLIANGYMRILGSHLFVLTLLTILSYFINRYYSINLKSIIKK